MLLDAVYFGGKKIGNIAEDGVDWGGDNAEYIKLYAAQVRNSPVKKIRKKAASNVLKFNLIELLPENCVAVMGGKRYVGRYGEDYFRHGADGGDSQGIA